MKLIKNTTVAVLALWRDSESYLKNALTQFENLETTLQKQNISICYGFFENDSEDKTPALLQSWLKTRTGFLITERIGARKWGSVPSSTRTKYQARYRNMALDLLRTYYNFDYLLVADTDVIWHPGLVTEMILALEDRPCLGMITPKTTQNVESFTEDLPYPSYYDSWALLDSDSNQGLTFADNPFLDPNDRKQWAAGEVVSVSSAFGSIALIRGEVFDSDEVMWDGENGCEHWHFCKTIRNQGYQIGVDPTLFAYVIHEKDIIPHPEVLKKEKTRLSIAQSYSLQKSPGENPPISFGITTGFTNVDHLLDCITSIRNQRIPTYEILLIGPDPNQETKTILLNGFNDLTFIPFDETIRSLWITKKKNTLAQNAQYERLVLLHDYLTLGDGWYRNFCSFELLYSWTVLAFPQIRADGGRFWYDWSGFNGPRINDDRVFFDYFDWSNNDKVYISGNIFAVHRDLLLAYPLDESLGHMDEEDLEWSNRLRSVVHFKCADGCIVQHQKSHRDLDYFRRIDALHEQVDML